MIKINGFRSAHGKLTARCGMIQFIHVLELWISMISNFKTASSLLWRIDTVIFGKLNNLIKAPPHFSIKPSLSI